MPTPPVTPPLAEDRQPQVSLPSGILFGKMVGKIWLALLAFNLVISNTSFHESPAFDDIAPLTVGGWFLCSGLLAIASFVGGIQKGRPLLAVISMILTPIGFLFVLFSEPREAVPPPPGEPIRPAD